MLVTSVDDCCRLPFPRRQVKVVSHFSVHLTFYHIQLQQRHNLFPPGFDRPFEAFRKRNQLQPLVAPQFAHL